MPEKPYAYQRGIPSATRFARLTRPPCPGCPHCQTLLPSFEPKSDAPAHPRDVCDPHCGSRKKLKGPGSDALSPCEEEEEEQGRADNPHLIPVAHGKRPMVDVSPLEK